MKKSPPMLLTLVAAFLAAPGNRAQGADITVLSGTVTRSAITKIGALFEQQTGIS
jgi:hypothetical protein